MSAPPAPALPAEQLGRFAGPLKCAIRQPGRQRADRAGQQELGPLGLLAPDLIQALDGLVRLGQRIPWQPGGEQGRAPFDTQGRIDGSDLVEPDFGLIEARQSSRQVATAQREYAAVNHGVRRLQLLPVRREQLLGTLQVHLGPPHRTGCEVGERPRGQRAGLPDLIVGQAQRRNRVAQVG